MLVAVAKQLVVRLWRTLMIFVSAGWWEREGIAGNLSDAIEDERHVPGPPHCDLAFGKPLKFGIVAPGATIAAQPLVWLGKA